MIFFYFFFKKQLLGIPRCFSVSSKDLEEILFSRDVILNILFLQELMLLVQFST